MEAGCFSQEVLKGFGTRDTGISGSCGNRSAQTAQPVLPYGPAFCTHTIPVLSTRVHIAGLGTSQC